MSFQLISIVDYPQSTQYTSYSSVSVSTMDGSFMWAFRGECVKRMLMCSAVLQCISVCVLCNNHTHKGKIAVVLIWLNLSLCYSVIIEFVTNNTVIWVFGRREWERMLVVENGSENRLLCALFVYSDCIIMMPKFQLWIYLLILST